MPACAHCGRDISPRATACPACGEPGPAAFPGAGTGTLPPPTPSGPPAQPGSFGAVIAAVPRTEPFALASIVCAVANFFGAFVIGAILAIVFGKIAQKNIAQNPALEGANLARTGVIVGWVGIAIGLVFLLLAVAMLGVFGTSHSEIIQVPTRVTGG